MSVDLDETDLAKRYSRLLAQVRAAALSSPFKQKVTLLAVSKTQPAEAIEELYRLGHRDFGENYVQELTEKAEILAKRGCNQIRWHFIGHLQTNKVKQLLPYVFSVHSVDSERLGLELSKRWEQLHGKTPPPLPVFIEVNLQGEKNKAGIPPAEAKKIAASLNTHPSLLVQGLMAIPSADNSAEETRKAFAQIRELETKCRPSTRGLLSMGMSGDFEVAIAQGATHIRVGTALFGPRPVKKS